MSAEGSKQGEQTVTGKHAGTENVCNDIMKALETPRILMVLELLQHRLMSQEIQYLQFSSLNMHCCKLGELILACKQPVQLLISFL